MVRMLLVKLFDELGLTPGQLLDIVVFACLFILLVT